MKVITVKFRGSCAECGASIAAGDRAHWGGAGSGVVVCLDCGGGFSPDGDNSAGAAASRRDPGGYYSVDGRLMGRESCGCEDYPCCGH